MRFAVFFFSVLFCIQSIHAQIIEIPDANFKNALVNTNCVSLVPGSTTDSNADTNNDGEIQVSEAEAVFSIAIYHSNINSMIGIEYFTNLERLYCDFNSIDVLDLSNNINLKVITCDFNGMTSINTSNCVNLESLTCSDNAITSFDLSDNINLESLRFDRNSVAVLDVTNNVLLNHINCDRNNIISLDLSNNINLETLRCGSNLFETLDLSNNSNLSTFTCMTNSLGNTNRLKTIDFSNNINLSFFSFYGSPDLTAINLKNGNRMSAVQTSSIAGCSNLVAICVDANEVDQIQALVDYNGYTNCNVVTDCSGLSVEEYALNTITVYPNPVAEKLYISSKDFMDSITFYNVSGSLIKTISNINQRKLEIDIKDFSDGVYFLKVHSNTGVFSSKIVKN